MANTATDTGASPAPKGFAARVIGIVLSPRDTFTSVVAQPSWVGVLMLTTLVVAICTVLPMTTPDGKQAAIDAAERRLESFGVQVSDEMHAAIEKSSARTPYTTGISILVVSPIMTAIIAGILFGIFNAVMGGSAKYKQVFAVVVHASVISALGALFSGPVNYVRGSVESVTNLGALFPMLPEGAFITRFAGMIDVFLIWWLFVLSVGLAVLYRRRTQPIAVTLFSVYAVIALGFASVMAVFGGKN